MQILKIAAAGLLVTATFAAPALAHGPAPAGVKGEKRLRALETSILGARHAADHAALRATERRGRTTRGRRALARVRARAAVAVPGARDRTGEWEAPFALKEIAIHSALMPTGKVLTWGVPRGGQSNRSDGAAIWDPVTGESRGVRPPMIDTDDADTIPDSAANLFCSGMSLLADGRVFVAGGTLSDPKAANGNQYTGLLHTFVFDPWTETWMTGPSMKRGRWYPTQVELPNGDIVIASGNDEIGGATRDNLTRELEVYHPEPGGPGTLTEHPAGFWNYKALYPHLHTLPDGNVLMSGPAAQDNAILRPSMLDLPGLGAAWDDAAIPGSPNHFGGSAVMRADLDDYDGTWRVMQLTGYKDGGGDITRATPAVDTLDASPAGRAAGWSPAAEGPLAQGRFYGNTVLLPDASLLEVGGGNGNSDARGNWYIDPEPSANEKLRNVEILDAGAPSWRLGAAQQEWRTYHSTALLLPDGRVLSAGDDGHEGPDPENPLADPLGCPAGATCRRDSGELYSPPYLFDGDGRAPRPAISSSPAEVGYGATFGIGTAEAGAAVRPVRHAVLMAPSAVTHSTDMNQRLVPMRISQVHDGAGINVVAPANASIAPPGYYLIFLLDDQNTPSTARWVRLGADAPATPPLVTPATAVVAPPTNAEVVPPAPTNAEVVPPAPTNAEVVPPAPTNAEVVPPAPKPPTAGGGETASDRTRPNVQVRITASARLRRAGRVQVRVTSGEAATIRVRARLGGTRSFARSTEMRFRRRGTRTVTVKAAGLPRLGSRARAVVQVRIVALDLAGNQTRRTLRGAL